MKNLKITVFILLLALCFTLVACNSADENTADTTDTVESTVSESEESSESDTWGEITVETTTDADTETETATATETESVSETESESESETATEQTTEPRFDYFSESMEGYISIDKSVYDSIDVTVSSEYRVDDALVDKYIESLLFQHREKANGGNKVTNVPLKRGDSAFIFYKGIMNGEEFEGGSNMNEAAPYELALGSGNFVPGFEEGLIGVVPSETSPENMVSINLTFPENYYEDLAGKEVTFYVYITWSVEYNIPEYTESFVRDTLKFESEESDIIAAHRANIKAGLEAQVQSAIADIKNTTVWETLIDAANVIKYPEYEVEFHYNYYYSEIEYYYDYYTYMGMKFESLDDFAIQFLGLEKDGDWRAEITSYAQQDVTQTMLYYYIAEKENMGVTDEDYNAELDRLVEYYKNNTGKEYTKEEIVEQLGEDTVKDSALYNKVLNFLLERVNIVYQ